MSNKSLNIAKSSEESIESSLCVKAVCAADLVTANRIIASAVESWQVPERLKRLSLPMLQYEVADLAEFEMFLHHPGGSANGVAVLARGTHLIGDNGTRCALLHGLYVHADSQRSGVGRVLQQRVADRARELRCEGLLVKAQRVARSYFEAQGYTKTVSHAVDYPHLYWKPF